LLSSDPSMWEHILFGLEAAMGSEVAIKSDQAMLDQAFSSIERTTKEGLQRQMERLTGQSLWLGVFPKGLLDAFIDEHQKLIRSVQREHLDKISFAIKRGIREGNLFKDITNEIRRTTGMSKRRAQLIARNAPLHYSGLVTKHHQVGSGI